jgi:hypothetical protein
MCLQVAVLMQQFKDAKFSAIICMDAMRAPSARLDQVLKKNSSPRLSLSLATLNASFLTLH